MELEGAPHAAALLQTHGPAPAAEAAKGVYVWPRSCFWPPPYRLRDKGRAAI